MVIFINGSINSGKSTTSKLLAQRLDAINVEFDDIREQLYPGDKPPNFPKVIEAGIERINQLRAANPSKPIVANYVVGPEAYRMLTENIGDNIVFFTMAPPLQVALSDRGNRKLDQTERDRIQFHYNIGIHEPNFGHIIDTSVYSTQQVIDTIIGLI